MKGKALFLASFFLFFGMGIMGCDNPYQGKIKPKKKVNKKREARGMVLQTDLDTQKKKLSPKTPQDAIQGFFRALKKFEHSKAYAFLDSETIKELPEPQFLRKFGYETPFGLFLNQCIQAQVIEAKKQGNQCTAKVKILLPNLYKISKVGDRIQHEWLQNNTTLISDDELEKRMIKAISKNKKLDPEYIAEFTFEAFLVQEKGAWWIRFKPTWKNLKENYQRFCSQN